METVIMHTQTDATFSVQGFCDAHHISRGLFYKLLKEGNAPRIFKAGNRTLITKEAAKDWRLVMEKKSNQEAE